MILIGDKNSKRTKYFTKAAGQPGVFVVSVMEIEEFAACCHKLDHKMMHISKIGSPEHNCFIQDRETEEIWVKIDPCIYEDSNVEKMNVYLQNYQKFLYSLPTESKYHYLNTPQAILEVLDKRKCKRKLIENQIPVTPLLADKVESIEQLHDLMKQKKCNSIFLKPVLGSGAAGIAAYRWNWNRNQRVLYTSCKKTNGTFFNTKKIHKITDTAEIEETLKMLFLLDVIVEKWIPKAQYCGKSYDLRVVFQFGNIDYMIARQADGPMTNLHLNNQALDYESLNLPKKTIIEIEKICQQAMVLFPGLSYAGIDILLDKRGEKPYIIEINGQGDCVYQDMYGGNRIYCSQIKHMMENS